MAIIVDPDNLDREQVIYNTKQQLMSVRDIGTEISSALDRRTTGAAQSSSLEFTDSGAEFQTWNVQPGDVLAVFNELDAGHYVIDVVNSETSLDVLVDTPDFTAFSGSGGLVYSVHSDTGGTVADGATEQALYSFAKEEWRVDTEQFAGDDLIRHQFPFEAITREQMEVGGGTAHGNWSWFNEFTRKKVRTGGWADIDTAGTTLEDWTGVITLGSIDSDAQVYYQPLSASTDPVNFDFLGPVNEAINVFQNGSDFDTRQFLKLFVRKKGRTYAGSEISDIGVSTIETIVNRFPLAHAADPAIGRNDAEILGTSPFREVSDIGTDSAGTKNAGDNHITSSNSAFDRARSGDTVKITTGQEQNFYTIDTVIDPGTASIATDFEFTGSFATTDDGNLGFVVRTTDLIRSQSKALSIQDVDSVTGAATASGGPFTAEGVEADDLLHIIEDNDIHAGIYKITSRSSDSIVIVDTTDRAFPVANSGSLDYKVTQPGMYLQFKNDLIATSSTGDVFFLESEIISRSNGNWGDDGFTTGTIVNVAGTTDNDGLFTVASVPAGDQIQLVSTDTLTLETSSVALIDGVNPFKRVVDGTTFGFSWRTLGNGSTLAQVYQFIQHQLRQSTDIDNSVSSSRGDVTDLLMNFASPTATTLDMYIDDLNSADTNNVTWRDATSNDRTEKFIAAGTITFNTNLQNDSSSRYAMFFTNDDAGDDLGRDYGTPQAILVEDDQNTPISGTIAGAPSVSFTYDYDGNVQRGNASAGSDAPVTVVSIGLDTAQFVLLQGTIERNKSNNFALVAALERNYSNPS